MSKTITLTAIQADIIFKALHYTARHEGVDIPQECEEVFTVLADHNPNDTYVSDIVYVMEMLSGFIKNDDNYREYFEDEE